MIGFPESVFCSKSIGEVQMTISDSESEVHSEAHGRDQSHLEQRVDLNGSALLRCSACSRSSSQAHAKCQCHPCLHLCLLSIDECCDLC